jgi:hypothetical protein
MKKILASVALLAFGVALSLTQTGCSERDQSLAGKAGKGDSAPWMGAHNAYVAKGWKPGEETSWRNHMRARTQNQNEYLKTN